MSGEWQAAQVARVLLGERWIDPAWAVITDAGRVNPANLYSASSLYDRETGAEIDVPANAGLPVFELGELILVNAATGRELNAHGRSLVKWDVEYETFPFDQYEKAALRAIEVSYLPLLPSWSPSLLDKLARELHWALAVIEFSLDGNKSAHEALAVSDHFEVAKQVLEIYKARHSTT